MKRLSKILMLVLVVALSLGCVFAIASSAADEATGVTTVYDVNFDGATNFPWTDVHGVGVPRVVSSVGGNSYYEWYFYTAPGALADVRYQSFPNGVFQNDFYVIEFDVATATTLPANFGLYALCEGQDPQTGAVIKEGAGQVNLLSVVSGQLTTNGKVIPANENSDWTHITIVFDGVQTPATADVVVDGVPTTREYTSYDNTTVNVYADGVLISTSQPWVGKNVYSFRRLMFGYGNKLSGNIAAGESIAIDNWVETNCKDYLGTDTADLSMLFGENAITNLANYAGTELKFNANGYTYPENLGNVYVATANGNVMYKTVQDAINAIAKLEVEGDIHVINAEGVVAEDGSYVGLPSANVTVPVTIYTHGKAIAKPTVAGAVVETVGQDDVGETVYTYAKDAQSVTFEYYATYQDYLDMLYMATLDVKAGETPTAPAIESVYDKATGKVTIFKGWHYYDVDENDLGTEMPAFTEADYGTVYCAVAMTETIDALFWTVNGEDVTYYGSAVEFTNANLTGKTVVLGSNVVATETLTNVKLDLNGYTLESGAINLFNGGYVYSSVEGGTLINGGNLHSTDAGDKLYLGYINATTKSDYRIKLVVSLIAPTRNDQTYMYGCDVFTTRDYQASDAQGGALFQNAQTRTKIIRIDNCNFYCNADTRVFTAHKTSSYDAIVTNTNFYGKGTLISHLLYTVSGIVIKLENVHTYGEFQMVGNTGIKLDVGVGCSFANYNAQNVNSIAAGYWVKETDAKVTLADQTYVKTIGGETFTFAGGEFAVGSVVELAPVMATFKFYNVQIADVVTATEISSQTKYLGETATAPILSAKQEGGKFYNCTGWIVYNSSFEAVGELGAVTEEMNTQTYYCCPVWTEVEPAFAVVEGGSEVLYPEASLTNAVVTGKTIKLYADVTVAETLNNVTIDLNGYKFHSTATYMLTGNKNYIYNSNTETVGTVISNGSVLSNAATDTNYKVFIGYTASGKVTDGGRIEMTAPSFTGVKSSPEIRMYKVDFFNLTSFDINADKGLFWQQLRSITVDIDDCNFYAVANMSLFGGNQSAGSSYKVTISNTNFYGFGVLYSGMWGGTSGITGNTTLANVKMYGGFRPFGNGAGGDFSARLSLTADENCTFNQIRGTYYLPEGMIIVPSAESVTIAKTFVGADGTVYEMAGTYVSEQGVGTAADIKAIFAASFRNVNLDVNINYNLYIPAVYNVAGATETVTINDVEYWVVTFAKAPKDAYATKNVVTITINGVACEYDASVVSYATALLNVASESEYAVASKAMVKYVLNYIKTVAVAANAEADVAAISALLGEFALTDADKVVTGAIENVATINGVTGVALELNSAVGMVVRVAKDYVGTITVSIAGAETVTAEYTEAAEEDRYIVVGDIEIFNFTNDVVVTNGTETMTYNLATYVENVKTDVAYATYAYAVQAKAYNTAYGTPNTID